MIEYQFIEKPQKAENPTCFCSGFIIYLRWLHLGNKQMKNLSNLALVSLNNSTIKIAECILYCQHSITFDVTGSAIKRFIFRKEEKKKKQATQTNIQKAENRLYFPFQNFWWPDFGNFTMYGICFKFLKNFLNDKFFDFPLFPLIT